MTLSHDISYLVLSVCWVYSIADTVLGKRKRDQVTPEETDKKRKPTRGVCLITVSIIIVVYFVCSRFFCVCFLFSRSLKF